MFDTLEQAWIKENGEIPDGKVLVTRLGECHLEDAIQPTSVFMFVWRLCWFLAIIGSLTAILLLTGCNA